MSDARFGSWSTAESQVAIEYSLVVIEEIRHAVAEGFQRLSRGGVEVGGVLYGSREGRTIRILAMRPIQCEHARGPGFLLSDSDKRALEEQLKQEQEDPRLADMDCLGWFCSHTRSEIALTEADQQVYETYFGSPWQVTLIIHPGRAGSMRAGFFVREHDGAVRGEASYLEFNFPDRLAGVLDRAGRGAARSEERAGAARTHPVYFRDTAPAPLARELPAPAAPIQGPQLLPSPPPRSKWPWLVMWGVLVLVAVIAGLRYFVLSPQQSEPLALSVAERNGQLQISWNSSAGPIASAARGALTVTDGESPRSFILTPADLSRGSFNYQRVSDDVEIRMSVENASGKKAEEATTFLGPSPAKTGEADKMKAVEQERDDLKAQLDQLQQQNAAQAARIQQLERSLKVLQSRLGIQ